MGEALRAAVWAWGRQASVIRFTIGGAEGRLGRQGAGTAGSGGQGRGRGRWGVRRSKPFGGMDA